jgi:hypothetical protein
LVWGCFCFTSAGPAAHMYYVLIPLVTAYSFAIWDRLALKPLWKGFAIACLVASVWFQMGSACQRITTDSIYADRPRVVKAIQEKDYRLLGERRSWVAY